MIVEEKVIDSKARHGGKTAFHCIFVGVLRACRGLVRINSLVKEKAGSAGEDVRQETKHTHLLAAGGDAQQQMAFPGHMAVRAGGSRDVLSVLE